jgi:hypothetical protein
MSDSGFNYRSEHLNLDIFHAQQYIIHGLTGLVMDGIDSFYLQNGKIIII